MLRWMVIHCCMSTWRCAVFPAGDAVLVYMRALCAVSRKDSCFVLALRADYVSLALLPRYFCRRCCGGVHLRAVCCAITMMCDAWMLVLPRLSCRRCCGGVHACAVQLHGLLMHACWFCLVFLVGYAVVVFMCALLAVTQEDACAVPAWCADVDFPALLPLFPAGDAVVVFMRALCAVSQEELESGSSVTTAAGAQSPGSPRTAAAGGPRLYSLQKVVECAYANMSRIRLVWGKLWAVIAAQLVGASCHPHR
jgi:hypothetical protein